MFASTLLPEGLMASVVRRPVSSLKYSSPVEMNSGLITFLMKNCPAFVVVDSYPDLDAVRPQERFPTLDRVSGSNVQL